MADEDEFSLDELLSDAPPPAPAHTNGDDPDFRAAAALAAGDQHPDWDVEPPTDVLVPDYADDAVPASERPLELLQFNNLPNEPPPEASILHRPDGRGLFYMAAVNSIGGDPGVGKTFAALLAVIAALAQGLPVLLIDYEDTPGRLRARLTALGVTDSQLGLVHGVKDPERFYPAHIDQLVALIGREGIAVVVIDSVTEALEAHDLDENQGGDYSRWFRTIPKRLALAGPAVILIDHRPKPSQTVRNASARGVWAVGSRHKLAAADLSYVLEQAEPFSRATPGKTGKLDLMVAKDKHGGIGGRGDIVARFELTPTTEGAVDHEVALPEERVPRDPMTGDRLTGVERLLSRRAEFLQFVHDAYKVEAKIAKDTGKRLDGISTKRIGGFIRGLDFSRFEGIKPRFRNEDLRDALYAWRDAGYVAHTEGSRKSDLWRPLEASVSELHPPSLLDDPDPLPVTDDDGTELGF